MKRLLAVAALAVGLAAFPAAGANATGESTQSTWFCIGIGHLNIAICQGNPLPDVGALLRGLVPGLPL